MKIYISGTIEGGDGAELEKKFKKVEDLIVELGHLPINPVQKLLGFPQLIKPKELLLKRIKGTYPLFSPIAADFIRAVHSMP